VIHREGGNRNPHLWKGRLQSSKMRGEIAILGYERWKGSLRYEWRVGTLWSPEMRGQLWSSEVWEGDNMVLVYTYLQWLEEEKLQSAWKIWFVVTSWLEIHTLINYTDWYMDKMSFNGHPSILRKCIHCNTNSSESLTTIWSHWEG